MILLEMADKSLLNHRAASGFDCFYAYSNFHDSFCKLFLLNLKSPGFNPALEEVTSSAPLVLPAWPWHLDSHIISPPASDEEMCFSWQLQSLMKDQTDTDGSETQ